MGWIVGILLASVFVIMAFALKVKYRELRTVRAAVKPLRFGLKRLQALAYVINSPESGEILTAVLNDLGVQNVVASDYEEFQKKNNGDRETREKWIRSNNAEVQRLRDENQAYTKNIEELKTKADEVGKMVANVITVQTS